jgi:hypothetical protein
MLNWANFIGLPYEEPFGCFAFVRTVVADGLGLPVTVTPPDPSATPLARVIAFQGALERWCRRVDAPVAGDLAIFASGRVVQHVGVVVDPIKRLMLHANAGQPSAAVEYDDPTWAPLLAPPLGGFYRYEPDR